MALCNMGGSSSFNLLATYKDFNKTKCFRLDLVNKCGTRRTDLSQQSRPICTRQISVYSTSLLRQPGLIQSPIVVRCSSQPDTQLEDTSEGKKPIRGTNHTIASAQVESLVADICETTSIAEFKLNLGGFRLYLKRNLTSHDQTSANLSLSIAPVSVDSPSNITYQNGSATSSSLAVVQKETSSGQVQTYGDANSDEGLVMLPSPKVGLFRMSRTIKGKRTPPQCKEKQEVKEGQVLCYIEILGAEIPIESDFSGEVVKILRKDGEPVGYGDALIAILPSFPGIKKLLPA